MTDHSLSENTTVVQISKYNKSQAICYETRVYVSLYVQMTWQK